MAPVPLYHEAINLYRRLVTKPTNASELILEAWGQGFMVGALIIMMCITLANMRKGVLLHKLILLEVRFPLTLFLHRHKLSSAKITF
jgi:hypothetical protein